MTLEEAIDEAGSRVIERLERLRGISGSKDFLERILFSASAEEAAHRLRSWMEEAGMAVRYDELTNVYGSLDCSPEGPEGPRIHLGSHYDTVVNAGAFDGTLGVLLAIAVAEVIGQSELPLRHNLTALAFCDEEGVRFNTTFLGSAYLSGQFERGWLDKQDASGKTLGQWLVDRAESIEAVLRAEAFIRPQDCFLEAHIEQGPVLESMGKGLGVFTRIASQLRAEVSLIGLAGHAGTTPARLRRDPLPTASRMVLAVDELCRSDERLRATVGLFEVRPNASNVIPGAVRFSIDLRAPTAEGLEKAHQRLVETIETIARQSEVDYSYRVVHRADDVQLDERIVSALSAACEKVQGGSVEIFSGAGHDSMKIAQICPSGMLAVRCRGGLSHHPEEHASEADCRLALRAMVDAVLRLDQTF